MTPSTFIEHVRFQFLEGNPEHPGGITPSFQLEHQVRLIEIKHEQRDIRPYYGQKANGWLYDKELGSGESYMKGNEPLQRWDVAANGTLLCYRGGFNLYKIYKVEMLTEFDIRRLEERINHPEKIEALQLQQVPLLTNLLVEKMYPYNKLFNGELETIYGIHLHMIQSAPHRHLFYKPRDRRKNWVYNGVLNWGSNTGWDISTDGAIACCRVDYDEYYNFEIEVLSEEEQEVYRKKYNKDLDLELRDNKGEIDEQKLMKYKRFLDTLLAEIKKDETVSPAR